MKRSLTLLTATLAGALAARAEIPKDHLEFFESKVRPLLADACYKCHSEANDKTKGGLALDSKAGWEKGGDSGTAIKPGDPDGSLLIKAVRYTDEDMQMPPKGEKLPAESIAILEQWVKMGAPDPRSTVKKAAAGDPLNEEMRLKMQKHWAFQPVKEPALPAVKDTAWPANPVDHFILAKLEEKGLKPAAPADKRTLIRRAFLDLIGLPPEPEQVIAFVKDESPDAFAKVVDYLLASPHYGERWGRHWLDVARYADTRGESKRGATTLSPYAWTYRDYVIRSLNADKPFDQFIREQIAADQLSHDGDPSALAALGFLTQGDQFMDNRNDIINDQIDVVTKGFLGLTVSCARCHDHFFDPVTQRDYYALHGVFNSSMEPDSGPQVARPADPKATDEYQKERARLLAEGKAKVINQLNQMAGTVNAKAESFLLMVGVNRQDPKFFELMKSAGLDRRQAGDISRLVQRKMQQQGARGKNGRGFGTGVLGPWILMTRLPEKEFAAGAARIIAGLEKNPQANRAVKAALAGKSPQTLQEAAALYAGVFQQAHQAYTAEYAEWNKSRSVIKTEWFPGLKDKALEEVRTSIVDPYIIAGEELESNMRGLPQDLERQVNQVVAEVAKLDTVHPGSPGLANVLTDVEKPRNSAVLLRGQAQQPGPIVPRGFLECLSAGKVTVPDGVSGRLQIAEAIASPQNPLTPRVLVNRVWQHHFGEGFISTPDDIGTMSEKPTHPELLDYLAARFLADGWSLKKLHRTILLSRTWQQSSEPSAENAKIDPFNRLLWRANVRKLDFESLRDSILHMGGKLDTAMGGRPVNIETEPYSPRRSIYGFIDRTQMAEFMRHFDVANPTLPTGRRHETIVPQQALFRMNSLLVIEQARHIVDRKEFQSAQNDTDRVRQLYEIIYQRWPKPEELKLALEFIASARAPLGSNGDAPPPQEEAGQLPPELAKHFPQEKVAKMSRERLVEYVTELRRKGTLTKDDVQTVREHFRRQAVADAKSKVEMARGNPNAVKEAVRDPNAEEVDRSPLTPWEKLSHALLMTNEVGYVN